LHLAPLYTVSIARLDTRHGRLPLSHVRTHVCCLRCVHTRLFDCTWFAIARLRSLVFSFRSLWTSVRCVMVAFRSLPLIHVVCLVVYSRLPGLSLPVGCVVVYTSFVARSSLHLGVTHALRQDSRTRIAFRSHQFRTTLRVCIALPLVWSHFTSHVTGSDV